MIIERNASAPDDERQAYTRVEEFLLSRGYRQVRSGAEFRRGSLLGSLISCTPRGWAATVRVERTSERYLTSRFSVNTIAQSVSNAELMFWEAEADGVADCVRGMVPESLAETDLAVSRNASAGRRLVVQIIGLGIGVFAVFVLLDLAGLHLHPAVATATFGAVAANLFTRFAASGRDQ